MKTPIVASPAVAPAPEYPVVCPRCGLTEAELRSDGRMGCAGCYETFSVQVEQAVAALHGVRVTAPAAPAVPAPAPPAPPAPPATGRTPRDTLPWPTRRAEPTQMPSGPPPGEPVARRETRKRD